MRNRTQFLNKVTALALALVAMPAGGDAVAVAAQTELALPAGAMETRELPQIGDKLIPLGRTTGIKLYSPGTVVVGFSQLECSGTCPARNVQVKDTTGAGDAFCAGVAIGLTYGKTLAEAIDIGSILAASVIISSENVCPRFLPGEFGIEI